MLNMPDDGIRYLKRMQSIKEGDGYELIFEPNSKSEIRVLHTRSKNLGINYIVKID